MKCIHDNESFKCKKCLQVKIDELEFKLDALSSQLESKPSYPKIDHVLGFKKQESKYTNNNNSLNSLTIKEQITQYEREYLDSIEHEKSQKGTLPKGFEVKPRPPNTRGTLPKGFVPPVKISEPNNVKKYFEQYEQYNNKQKPIKKISTMSKILIGVGIAKVKQPDNEITKPNIKSKSRGTLPQGF